MRWGTSHFVSLDAAERYYRNYGETAADVGAKIEAREIHIGKPMNCEPDEVVTLDRSEGRYFIERRG
jgi:hypothetical protein